jgi:pimeloyl-ACP methyl ester carboxylesterase
MCKLKKQQVNSSIIRTDHGEIEYRTIGNGQPIVFIHGGHSNCHETLSCKGFDLERFQLIIPSRPGYGNTPLANNNTPGKAAGLIAELLEILSIDKAIIYGISAGGLTAIELAAVFPIKLINLYSLRRSQKNGLIRKKEYTRLPASFFILKWKV